MNRSLLPRFIVVLAVFAWGCSPAEAPPASSSAASSSTSVAPSRPTVASERVAVQRVELDTLVTLIESSGSVRARRVSRLGAEVSGKIVKVYVDVGDHVEVGDPLFQVDPLPYAMTLADAKAALMLARAERDNALRERDRVERLMAESAVSRSLRDDQQAAAIGSVARVAQLVVNLERAKRDIDKTVVRAPYAGSIVERLAHEGEMAGAQPVVTLQETGELEVVLNIPESAHASVRTGSAARVFVEGLVEPIDTVVHRVNDRVDAATRTYEVRAPLDDPTRTAKAGSYVRAEIRPIALEPRPVVDRSTVLMRDGRTYVFKVEGEVVRRVAVRVRAITAERAEIVSGLDEGDVVVTGEAISRLADGDPVTIQADLPAVATATVGATR